MSYNGGVKKAIVAIDSKRGMAGDHGIPWHLPADLAYYREKTSEGAILMGYGTYVEFKQPFHNRLNYVATTGDETLRAGFEPVHDARAFLTDFKEDIWVIGGAGLLAHTLDLLDELYITQLQGDWHCTKFFPEFKDKFELAHETEPQIENGITYTFQVWKHKDKE